jgi:hypothetical protein
MLGGQSPYYSPAPEPAPPTRARSWPRRLRLLAMAALAGLILAVVTAGYLIFGSQTGSASVAVQRFCDALTTQSYAAAYAELSSALQQEGNEAQFAASQRDLDRLNGVATSCAFSNPQVRGAAVTFILHITRSRAGPLAGSLQMVHESGAWKVANYDANVV